MRDDVIEGKWIEAFEKAFRLCAVEPGEVVAILSETQSRQLNVKLAELALDRLGARVFHIVMPTPRLSAPVPVRSTGASDAIQRIGPVVEALASSDMIVDLTVEGTMHAPETMELRARGARLYYISNEHPEILERLKPDPALRPKVERGVEMLAAAREMRVTSAAGTDLVADVFEAVARGAAGLADTAGRLGYWPAGLCLCFPQPGAVNGRLVLAPGLATPAPALREALAWSAGFLGDLHIHTADLLPYRSQVLALGGRPAVGVAGRADGDEYRVGVGDAVGEVGGEAEPAACVVARDHLLQAVLVDRHDALLQAFDLVGLLIDADGVETEFRKADAGHQPDVAGANHCDLHGVSL